MDGLPPTLEITRKWKSLPLERRREVLRRLLSVTLLPAERHGQRKFDPSTILITTAYGQQVLGRRAPEH